jgi:hypothetical protein
MTQTWITLATKLTGPTVGALAQANAFAARHLSPKSAFATAMNAAIFELAPKANLRADIVVARSALETGNWLAELFLMFGNPGGLGKFPDGTYVGGTFATPGIAAKAMLAHFVAYVYGRSINTDTDDWKQYDPRWQPALDLVAEKGTISTVGEFGNGMWATSASDAPDLVTRFNEIFDAFTLPVEPPQEDPPMALTFGRVPYPDVVESHLSASNPWIKSGAPDIPDAVFWHRMVGSWQGTDGWFHGGNAATAYGVSVKATDGVGGKIYEWIGPTSGLYGESSGPAVAPYGDGLKLINKVGVANVNRRSRAIEISGNYDTPLDDDAIASVVTLTAYWADRKHIPWNEFPMVPGEDRSYVVWHQEITGPDYKECPGEVVMDATPEMIERVKARLKHYQETTPATTTTPAPPKPASIYPKGMNEAIARERFGHVHKSYGDFRFDPDGPVSRAWLKMISDQLQPGESYTKAKIGPLTSVVRRQNDRYREFGFAGMKTVRLDMQTGKVV